MAGYGKKKPATRTKKTDKKIKKKTASLKTKKTQTAGY